MEIEYIPFRDTKYFSALICDYLEEDPKLKQFYNRFPNLDNFKEQIQEKQSSYSVLNRKVLVDVINQQYKDLDVSEATLNNLNLLSLENTFSITTGHQLNLFTGPLYFLYKIVSTINLSSELNKKYPSQNFVPVYWMATEDHDFEEINYFNFKGKKIQLNRNANGAVGELSTEGLDEVFDVFSLELGIGIHAEKLKNLFKSGYLQHSNLADATRYIANELFKDYGLVIVDANNKELKTLFAPFIKDELLNETSFKEVSITNKALSDHANIQVNPREINLFYLNENLRERIIFKDNLYKVNNTDITFSKSEILNQLDEAPERFSPNVIMRPLYQEVVLPNLCYIGGGGELAYWFQLKQYFNKVEVPFPVLLLRNSVLIQTIQQSNKLKKLNISTEEIFQKRDVFINKKVREISDINIDFSEQKLHLQEQFKQLYSLAERTDKSFLGAVQAQEKKQLKGLSNLEKRLLKAQKRKLENHVSRMTELQNQLFPNQSLQERSTNYSELYLNYGKELIPKLIEVLRPLKGEFLIINI